MKAAGKQMLRIREIYEVGPRTVTRTGKRATVYLGKDFNFLIGRKVILQVKVLEELGGESHE